MKNSLNFYDSRVNSFGLIESFGQIVQRHELLFALVQRDLFAKYKRSILGIGWSVLNPILTTSVIYLVFNGIFAGRLPNQRGYATYIYTGVLLQMLVISGIPAAANSLSSNWQYITKMRLPPHLFAIATSISGVVQFYIGLFALIPLWVLTKFSLTPRVLLIPIFLMFISMALSGIGLLLSGLMIRYDDMNYIIGVVIMILGYLTPIFYTLDSVPERLARIIAINPLTQYVDVARFLIIGNSSIQIYELLFVPIFSTVLLLLGFLRINKKWNDWIVLL
jgi:ABC-type polysaccharide/polyol phosphate export permease